MNLSQLREKWQIELLDAQSQHEYHRAHTIEQFLKDVRDVRVHSMKDMVKTYREGFKEAVDALHEAYNAIEGRDK